LQHRQSFTTWFKVATFIILAVATSFDASAQTTGQASPLPHHYRELVARAVIFEFARTGKGPSQISEQHYSKGANFCVCFPVKKRPILFEATTGTEIRSFRMTITRNIFGKLSFQYQGAELFDKPCAGVLKPFPELEQMAAEVKTCQAKTGRACGADAFALPNVQREIERLP
jgi:hypothetical protein